MKEKCDYCGQSQEEFYYPLKHPSRCLKKIEDEKNELRAERNNLLEQFPTNTKEHREYLIGLTKERDAALLQVDALKREISGRSAITAKVQYDLEASHRLNGEYRKALVKIVGTMQGSGIDEVVFNLVYDIAVMAITDLPKTEKRIVSPQKCESYWDGNQCEGDQGHEGKHRFMGWTWAVSPPPLTCECGAALNNLGHLCGYWKPQVGGTSQ